MSSMTISTITIAAPTKVQVGTTSPRKFVVDADEGKLVVEISAPYGGYYGGSVTILFDGKFYKTIGLSKGSKLVHTIAKVFDRGIHYLHVNYADFGSEAFIYYSAYLEIATVTQPIGPPKPTMPPSPTEPPPVERGCFLFAIGLIALKILMTIVL